MINEMRQHKTYLTGPKLRPGNMSYNFHIDQRSRWILKFCVQYTRLETQKVSNIYLPSNKKENISCLLVYSTIVDHDF